MRVRYRPHANTKTGYLPTLDGWRAIAVVLTILYHDVLHRVGPFSTAWIQEHGRLGVDIFFAISGLLICSRLMDEEASHGQISLRQFYIRRFFRIVPPMLLYLLVVGTLGSLHEISVAPREWFGALFFFRNYSTLSDTLGQPNWFTGHYWSLSVEEHFYLLLPGVLLLTRLRWRLPALATMIVVVDAWRVFRQQTRPYDLLANHTDTRLDALLFPALLAVLLATREGRAFLDRLSRLWLIPAAVLIALLTWQRFPVFTPVAQSILIPLVLVGTMLHPAPWFSRCLELMPLRWLGRISYSLYLWQQLFFVARFQPQLKTFGWLQEFPGRWLMLFACAALSYYVVERPLMKLGHRLAPPATPGRPELSLQGSSAS